MEIARGWGKRERRNRLIGIVLVLKDKKNSGDGLHNSAMHLILWKCTLMSG